MARLLRRPQRRQAFRNLGREAEDRAGNAAGDGLAQDEEIGRQIERARVAAGTGADGVRLVYQQERPGAPRDRAQGVVEARLRQHHADVGERRLGDEAGDIAGRQRRFERSDVIELDDLGMGGEIEGLADQARAVDRPAVLQPHEGLVDGAVIAAVEDEDLRPAREPARQA
jgi:hypothetical protein